MPLKIALWAKTENYGWWFYSSLCSFTNLVFCCFGHLYARIICNDVKRFLPGSKRPAFAAFAIGISLLLFIITFLIPYLRKKGTMTRFLGIMALGDALWWVYLGFFS